MPPDPAQPDRERDLIREALFDLVFELSYEQIEVETIVERAGVDAGEFSRRFKGKDDCFMDIFWEYVGIFEGRVWGAYEEADNWRDGIRAAAYAAADYIDEYPRATRFGVIQMLGVGPLAQAHRERFLQRIVDMIDQGRGELDDPDSIGRSVAEGVLGSIYESLAQSLRAGDGEPNARDAVPGLMYVAVRPYLGHEVAREELEIPPPPERVSA